MRWLAVFLVFIGGCSTTWDPHAPGTVVAPEKGGDISVEHGQRLLVKLPPPAQGNEWRMRQPLTLVLLQEGPPAAEGLFMTPVRSGTSTLRLVEVPEKGEGEPQRELAYQLSVP